MMRRRLTIGRFIARQQMPAELGKMNHPTTTVRRGKFEEKNIFSIFFKSNGFVFIHAVDEGKTIDHNYYIENCLKSVVKEIWKQKVIRYKRHQIASR